MSFLICHFKMFTMSITTEFRNIRFFSSTRLSSFCFFEICKIWNRILIKKKSIFCNILNTMFNFNNAITKIESLFVKILMIFRNTSSSQFSTFTKRCNFDCESIFWNFDREKKFLSRFFKIFFVVIKDFFFRICRKLKLKIFCDEKFWCIWHNFFWNMNFWKLIIFRLFVDQFFDRKRNDDCKFFFFWIRFRL